MSKLEFYAITDPGMVRSHNEDNIAVQYLPDGSAGLVILADGMGGHNAGEVASAIAVSVLMEAVGNQLGQLLSIPWPDAAPLLRQRLVDGVRLANLAIFSAASERPECYGMGTTLTLALFHHNMVTIVHVGDSRAYRLRTGSLQQLTSDHSVLQEQIDAGVISAEEAHFSMNKNVITRALGVEPDVLVDVYETASVVGDVYLLCSDGLSDMLLPLEIRDDLLQNADDPQALCQMLVDHANATGGRDNISVALVCQAEGAVQDPGNGHVERWVC
ncbi:Stp1/IreP family PP2C-type Ser/Thr phosphatase [Massilia sp. W12]|uniref:Stp1/IreP family PP2C-type Ser/Thr phosphatase n=1 Tax=Massilia sp. W12 TaxID=3126507 RepID=UPI0030CE735D